MGWDVLLEIGFWGWIISVFLFILKGLDRQDRIIIKNAVIFGVFFIIFYLLWILGMVQYRPW